MAKVPSIKLGRVVQCESILEAEAAQLLDACPGVLSFGEQPLILHYRYNGHHHWHIPDFALVTEDGVRELIEIKFHKNVDNDVLWRTALLADYLKPFGVAYRLLTERDIRSGHRLDNAKSLLRRGRERANETWSLNTYERIRSQGSLALEQFGWQQSGRQEAGWIAREIIEGQIRTNLLEPLSEKSCVVLETLSLQEDRLWLPAVL
ncbi:MAG: hypothetical protein ACREPB_16415 [Arenimonas sp.]